MDMIDVTALIASATEEEVWAVYNDPDFMEPRFASGEVHPGLRELILETPLYTSPIPGPAKRYMLWTNENRAQSGAFVKEGFAILRTQTVTRTPFRTVTGQELEEIDAGRRPNG